ncbi:MAG: flagellar filament capping protein FliD [Schwartzia sp.]|nr:flagellar filament capping protein FliD [Schwartzia sp. (in: firmicutes)]
MATISSMARNTYTAYKGLGSTIFSGASDTKWSAYSSASANSSNAVLTGLMGISSSKAELLSTYNSAAKTFKTDFGSAMSALKDSAAAMKNFSFAPAEKGDYAITTKTAEDGTTTTEYSDSLKKTLGAIKDFIGDYNDAIGFFNENADVSARVKNLASAFGDTTYRAGTLSKIGISVNNSGKMTINEGKLAQALVDNPGQVETILGKGGLASKAESNVSLANSQSEQLFPSVSSTLGKDFKNSEMYTGQSLLRISQYSSVGNFLSLLA